AITLLGACPEHTCFAELIEELVGHYLLSGNAYVHARMIGDAVGGLASLRPDRMTVKTDRAGWPTGFDYTNGTQRLHFPSRTASGVAPVLHLKSFHPTDDHYGLAPLQAAATAIDIHNAASAWNKALLDNAARPSGALVYQASGGKLSDLQFERLKTELEDGFQGARNAGRPLLLEGGLDWKSMGLSPRDMDFLEAKNGAAREIALAIGVPPMLLGIPGDNTFANYKEANRAFWRQTVLPLARKLTAAFTQWLQPISPAPFTLKLQTDNLPALASETESLWAQLSASDFLTDGEKRARAGFPPRSPSS
ncbi:MAG: phage portal protein, partial [Pseudomonadota bacterium]